MFAPYPGPQSTMHRQPTSSKVVIMSTNTRRHSQESAETSETMFTEIEQELAAGYLEVEITGLTLRRLIAVYAVLLRGAWAHTMGGVRSLVRPTPAL